ncbi:AIR synthase family protein [Natronoarchaeum sp. GCM10025321]|uniref:AIR synthase family protein n=1 Tax=Natronoarchaeum sp. GCM10025321 TaxID=3252684 RepID=UPI00360DEE90
MVGKLDPGALAAVLDRTGGVGEDVLVGPAYGEDAAVIDLGDELLIISSDPISLATERIGTLGVHVACNDVAVSGADPEFLTAVLQVPSSEEVMDADGSDRIEAIMADMEREANTLDVSIVGGHTEYVDQLSRPILSMTAMGRTDRAVLTGGAEPGDRVVLTKGAGIEATAILATDFREDLEGIPDDVLDRGAEFFDEISVVPDARVLREWATAMHDPTEGGVFTGLIELATASGVALDVETEAISVRTETARLCAALDLDPLNAFGSGAVLATVSEADIEAALDALADAGIEAADIGAVLAADEPALFLDGERFTEPEREALYTLWDEE